jgi:hypothetical protein
MALFERGDRVTPPLSQILYDDFPSLRRARAGEDLRIESFFGGLDAARWCQRSLHIEWVGCTKPVLEMKADSPRLSPPPSGSNSADTCFRAGNDRCSETVPGPG